jgi:hypothetical protein
MTGLDLGDARRTAANKTARTARQAQNSKVLDRWARIGIAARGLVYVLIGVLAIQIAVGRSSQQADQKGAFQTLAGNTGGVLVLWLVALGLVGYAVWQGTEAAWGYQREDGKKKAAKRGLSLCRAVLYLAIAALAIKTAVGGGSGDSSGGQTATAKVLGMSGGRFLVALVGLVVVGIGAALAWEGVKADFAKELNLAGLSRGWRRAIVVLGKVGYVARGLVFALAGALVVAAAVTFDPSKARGLDAALRTLAGQPYGPYLLGVAAFGLICFGVYSFADARYRRL